METNSTNGSRRVRTRTFYLGTSEQAYEDRVEGETACAPLQKTKLIQIRDATLTREKHAAPSL
jgi:hypothetical protein